MDGTMELINQVVKAVQSLSAAPLAICRAWATWVYGKRGEA